MGLFSLASLPSEEFLLGPARAINSQASTMQNPTVPTVNPYPDEEEEMEIDEQRPFDSQYRLKLDWANVPRNEIRASQTPLFSSLYAASLPIPSKEILTPNMKRDMQSQKVVVKKEEKSASNTIDFNRWQAVLAHNPTYKLVRKASKCLTTNDWNTAIQELTLFHVFEKIDELRANNQWSFRQTQRQVLPTVKDHWAYLLDEAVSGIDLFSCCSLTFVIEMDAS